MTLETQKGGHAEYSPAALGVLLASVIAIMLGPTGILLTTFSLFIAPMSLEFSWDRAQVVLLVTLFGLAVALSSPVKGWLIDRWGARRLMLVSTALLAPLLMALAIIEEVWQLRGLFLLLGIVAPGNMPYGKILGGWFVQRRGMAYGLLGLGFGIGGPFGLWVGHVCIETWGWRTTYFVYGVLEGGVALPLLWWLFRERAAQAVQVAAPAVEQGMSEFDAWRTPTFWWLLINQVLTVFVVSSVMTHGVPMLMERELTRGQAATVLSALSIGMVVSQPLMGGLMDRFQTPRVALPFALIAVLGMLIFESANDFAGLWLSIFLIGLGGGGESGTTKYFVARYFGLRRFSAIYGAVQPFTFALSISLGAWLIGALYDQTGSYVLAEWTLLGAFLLATLILRGFRPYPSRPEAQVRSGVPSEPTAKRLGQCERSK